MYPNLLTDDLNYILMHTNSVWEALRNQNIFITGGTGFFGSWLLESFVWINGKLQLNAHAVVLTRKPQDFAKKCPHLISHSSLSFHEGDITNFKFPHGDFSHVIHAATDANAQPTDNEALATLDTIVEGTKHILKFAAQCHAKRFLLISSGAVYGKQPSHVSHLTEDHLTTHDITKSSSFYGLGKITAEHVTSLYARQYQFDITIARCFAFVGPYLPLNSRFAIGNFIYNRLTNTPLLVTGDGTPIRSYLYAADLAICLWNILFKGKNGCTYNVGSDQAISIAELAKLIAELQEPYLPLKINQVPDLSRQPMRYVPDVTRLKTELNVPEPVPLKDAIMRTYNWYRLSHQLEGVMA